MNREIIYLDTSIPSAYFDDRVPERQKSTKKFWEMVLPEYKAVISEITIQELNSISSQELLKKVHALVATFDIWKLNSDIISLAQNYIEQGIFPEKYLTDALHIAIATYYNASYVISWNFEHMVKVKTRRLVNLVNLLKGYNEIEIISPQEL